MLRPGVKGGQLQTRGWCKAEEVAKRLDELLLIRHKVWQVDFFFTRQSQWRIDELSLHARDCFHALGEVGGV